MYTHILTLVDIMHNAYHRSLRNSSEKNSIECDWRKWLFEPLHDFLRKNTWEDNIRMEGKEQDLSISSNKFMLKKKTVVYYFFSVFLSFFVFIYNALLLYHKTRFVVSIFICNEKWERKNRQKRTKIDQQCK